MTALNIIIQVDVIKFKDALNNDTKYNYTQRYTATLNGFQHCNTTLNGIDHPGIKHCSTKHTDDTRHNH